MGILSRLKRMALGPDAQNSRSVAPPPDHLQATTPAAAAAPDRDSVLLGDPDLEAQIYGRDSCTYSGRARRLLKEQGLEHTYINLDSLQHRRLASLLAAETGQTTVPYIFVRGRFVGGSDELAEQVQLGQMQGAPADRVAVLAPPVEEGGRPAVVIELRESIDPISSRKRASRPETHKLVSPMKLMELGLVVEEQADGESVSVDLLDTVACNEGVPIARVFAGAALMQGLTYERSTDVHFKVCVGQCQSWGALARLEHLISLHLEAEGDLEANFDVEPVQCLDRCDKAPTMIVHTNDGIAALDAVRDADLTAAVKQLCQR